MTHRPPTATRGPIVNDADRRWARALAVVALIVGGASCASTPAGDGDQPPATAGAQDGAGTAAASTPTGAGPNRAGEAEGGFQPESDVVGVAEDIALEDTFVGITDHKRGGRIQVAFANKDHGRYLITMKGAGGGSTWRSVDREKLALVEDSTYAEKVFQNVIMKKMIDDLEARGFFRHAVALTGQALDDASDFAVAPGLDYALLVERGGRLWGLKRARPGSDEEYKKVYFECKNLLIDYTSIPAHKFSTQSADRAFGAGVPAPRR